MFGNQPFTIFYNSVTGGHKVGSDLATNCVEAILESDVPVKDRDDAILRILQHTKISNREDAAIEINDLIKSRDDAKDLQKKIFDVVIADIDQQPYTKDKLNAAVGLFENIRKHQSNLTGTGIEKDLMDKARSYIEEMPEGQTFFLAGITLHLNDENDPEQKTLRTVYERAHKAKESVELFPILLKHAKQGTGLYEEILDAAYANIEQKMEPYKQVPYLLDLYKRLQDPEKKQQALDRTVDILKKMPTRQWVGDTIRIEEAIGKDHPITQSLWESIFEDIDKEEPKKRFSTLFESGRFYPEIRDEFFQRAFDTLDEIPENKRSEIAYSVYRYSTNAPEFRDRCVDAIIAHIHLVEDVKTRYNITEDLYTHLPIGHPSKKTAEDLFFDTLDLLPTEEKVTALEETMRDTEENDPAFSRAATLLNKLPLKTTDDFVEFVRALPTPPSP